jgi:hypothetical protein
MQVLLSLYTVRQYKIWAPPAAAKLNYTLARGVHRVFHGQWANKSLRPYILKPHPYQPSLIKIVHFVEDGETGPECDVSRKHRNALITL